MPSNKNAYIRYKVLDECFRSRKKHYIEDLIEACNRVLLEIDPDSDGVSLRQVRADIAFMKSSEGWSIELGEYRDGRRMYYRYTDPSYSINNMPLTDLEVDQLRSAFHILSQFKGMPQFEWIHDLLPRLQAGPTQVAPASTVVDFDYNPDLKGIDHFGELYAHIAGQKVLRIRYKPFLADAPTDITLHPYYLKHYNNRWFLFGYNPETGKADWNLALDRIVSFRTGRERYLPNTTIDWEEYFDDIIGVTRPDDATVEPVTLRFFRVTGHYIQTKPLHRSQRSRWLDKETLEVTLHVMLNYELEKLILSYADSVRVMGPEPLVRTIRDRLQQANELYHNL